MCSEPSGNPAPSSTSMLRAELAEHFAPIPDDMPYVDWWTVARLAQLSQLPTNASRVGYRAHGANITVGAPVSRRCARELKSAEMRRQLVLHAAAEKLTTEQLSTIWRVFEGAAVHTARIANTVFLPLVHATDLEAEQGRAYVAEAEAATRAGRYENALRNRVMAVFANPWDGDSREWITDLGSLRCRTSRSRTRWPRPADRSSSRSSTSSRRSPSCSPPTPRRSERTTTSRW
jgi:hypothetical protein